MTCCSIEVTFRGIYDPTLIGDKPHWYSRDLTSIPFKIVDETSTLGQAVHSFNTKSNETEYTPTGRRHTARLFNVNQRSSMVMFVDESGSDSEDEDDLDVNSCYSSLSDFVSEMRSSAICGEIRGKHLRSFSSLDTSLFNILDNRIYPANQERTACVEYAAIYRPPEELQMSEQSNVFATHTNIHLDMNTSTMNSKLSSPLAESTCVNVRPSVELVSVDSKTSPTSMTPIGKQLPK
jgi:hypothetical protein